jgi:hypothetical protein
MMYNSIQLGKKYFFMVFGIPSKCKKTGTKKSRSSAEKSTSFYSEFHADFEYVVCFEKQRAQKMDLSRLIL